MRSWHLDRGLGMKQRSGWLFPLMVLAAGSVTAFGCVGIAAITGYLPLSRATANVLGDYPRVPSSLEQAPKAQVVQVDDPVVAVVAAENGNAKAIQLQADKQPSARKPAVN
jgi:hypothetical protein